MTCFLYGAGPLLVSMTCFFYGAGSLLVSMICSFYGARPLSVFMTFLFYGAGPLTAWMPVPQPATACNSAPPLWQPKVLLYQRVLNDL
jgi:hypothetical protein